MTNIRDDKIKALSEAIYEARRFVKCAKKAKKRLSDDWRAAFGSKETGAAKRASMDLTRALVRVRRGKMLR
jgi:hypothetical protein